MVTTKNKRDFIVCFLKNYTTKKRECTWILNYIIANDSVLETVKFVRDVESYPCGFIISTNCVDDVAFRYHKVDYVSSDAGKCFHDLRINRTETVFIELNFKEKETEYNYIDILEDDERNETYTSEMDSFIDKMLNKGKIELLKKEIDKTLDERDEEKFYKLTSELNRITG